MFCFLGWDWESFCKELADLGMNYEIYRYSRPVPGEYQIYKEVLKSADLLIYPGFDGGAMSVYDALNASVDVLASDISYHRDLGESVTLFADEQEFRANIDRLQKRHADRLQSLRSRSIQAYVDRLLAHWNSVGSGVPAASGDLAAMAPAERQETLQSFRAHYKTMLSPTRIRSFLIRWLKARLIRH